MRSQPPEPVRRPRVNQPMGYFPTASRGSPRHVYGRRHDYIYYPAAWIDESSGTSYEAGYYDENGQRYEDVAFEKNGRYENVHCRCEYCGHSALMSLDAGQAGVQSLQCPNCGAPMEIVSLLDTEAQAEAAQCAEYPAPNFPRKRKKRRWGLLAAVAVLAVVLLGKAGSKPRETVNVEPLTVQPIQEIQTVDPGYTESEAPLGDTIYFSHIVGNAYAPGLPGAQKALPWSSEDSSYVDEASQVWVTWNGEYSAWQYWVDGISSDFGDYGWMEHGADGWFIEESEGSWIPLPERYNTDGLWYIFEDPDFVEGNLALFGETLTLSSAGGNTFTVGGDGAAKELIWSPDDYSYCDAETESWAVLRCDYDPAVWQYWVEGISSDFGDYGWMEHDDEGWYILNAENEWIPLPESYDVSGLWYIVESP